MNGRGVGRWAGGGASVPPPPQKSAVFVGRKLGKQWYHWAVRKVHTAVVACDCFYFVASRSSPFSAPRQRCLLGKEQQGFGYVSSQLWDVSILLVTCSTRSLLSGRTPIYHVFFTNKLYIFCLEDKQHCERLGLVARIRRAHQSCVHPSLHCVCGAFCFDFGSDAFSGVLIYLEDQHTLVTYSQYSFLINSLLSTTESVPIIHFVGAASELLHG